ncbi:MAG: hypothetical protein K2F87_05335, partial [Muribaculaceae bacterium]|nr:hypothetical protein [Muribaculaceae bacterium]
MKRFLQSLLIGAGIVSAGILAQAAVKFAPAPAAVPAVGVVDETAPRGSFENPYSVEELNALDPDTQAQDDIWVAGYIVGFVNGTVANEETVLIGIPEDVEATLPSNIVISDVI